MTLTTALAALAMMPLGWWCAGFAARRNGAQPVDADAGVELALCDALESDPALWLALNGELRAEDFCSDAARNRWVKIDTNAREMGIAALALSSEEIAEGSRKRVDALLHERMGEARRLSGIGEGDVREQARTTVKLAEQVVGNALSREQVTSRSPLVANTGEDAAVRPLVREASVAGTRRRVICAGVTGALGAYCAILAPRLAQGDGAIWFFLALGVLGVGGLLIALVDLDTYYLDTPVFWTWAAAAWAAAVAACVIDGRGRDALVGVGATVAVATGFEAVAFVYSRLRGITQGFGDTLIAICTVGVPVALCGMFLVGIWSVLAASVLALGAWGIGFARGTTTAKTPLAYGPYLAAGWPVAMAVWAVLA